MTIKTNIQKILDSNITGYKIEKETGVSRAIISKLRSGERRIEDLTVDTAQKLLNFKGELNYKDYDDFDEM